jgi:hypothetical protein
MRRARVRPACLLMLLWTEHRLAGRCVARCPPWLRPRNAARPLAGERAAHAKRWRRLRPLLALLLVCAPTPRCCLAAAAHASPLPPSPLPRSWLHLRAAETPAASITGGVPTGARGAQEEGDEELHHVQRRREHPRGSEARGGGCRLAQEAALWRDSAIPDEDQTGDRR